MRSIICSLVAILSFFLSPAQVGIGIVASSQQSDVDLTDGLVGWWKMDNDADDYSGSGNHCTEINSPTYVTGQVDDAISFNGSAQYLDANTSDYDFGTTDFSVAFWIKTGTADKGIIGNFATTPSVAGWFFYVYPNTGGLYNGLAIGAYGAGGSQEYLYTTALVVDNNWHHVTAVFTRTGTSVSIEAFVDGVSKGSFSGTVGDISSGADLFIGTYLNSGNAMNGLLDDVRIYNRVLTQPEITILSGN